MKNDTIEEIKKVYKEYVSDKWSDKILDNYIRSSLKFNRPHQLKLSFHNLSNSKFWKQYRNKHPQWFDRRRLLILRNLTFGLNENNFDEIEKIENLFIKYYNSFILHNYQEQMIYKEFIFQDEFFDDIRKVASFIILNRSKMYNIIEEEISDEHLVFIFTAILFQIFEDPPHVFQYFKDDEQFWIWFKENVDECYNLYSYWIEWGWMKKSKELQFSIDEIQEYHEQQRKNEEAELKSVKWNEIIRKFR